MAVDGKTLDMTGTAIELAYIDAPEVQQVCRKDGSKWSCGIAAQKELARMVEGQTITCDIVPGAKPARNWAICRSADFDLGEEMVRRGMAIPLDRETGEYETALKTAQGLEAGLWASTFALPWVWRAANPERSSVKETNRSEPAKTVESGLSDYKSSGCLIKGNRNRRGEWIYHLPGRPYYAVTRAEEWFCSESDARQAGYRRSRS